MRSPAPRSLILLLLVAAAPAFAGSGLFQDSGQSLGGNALSNDVDLADLDGDGDLDAFVVNTTAPSVVLVNQGGAQGGTLGVFVDSGQMLGPASTSALGVALGDLDGDGDVDAFTTLDAFAPDATEIWINQGGVQAGTEGDFVQTAQMFGDDLQGRVALDTLDGDGALDAFVPRNVGRADKVWINDGSGAFASNGQDLGTASSFAVALGDLDGDGDVDAFVSSDPRKIWVNQGGAQAGTEGQFADGGQALGTGNSLGIALGDVDGDGDLDAVIGRNFDADIWVNQGGAQAGTEGDFLDSGQSLATVGQTRDVGLADLDGDGDLDVFSAVAGANKVFHNQGGDQGGTEGDFVDSGQNLGLEFTEGVALGDLDGDGDPDAFVVNFGDPDQVTLNGITCGDGNLDPGEQCDDGNNVDGDGCSATCTIEGGGVCPEPPRNDCKFAGKAKLSIKEKKAGKEKLSLSIKKVGEETFQADLGDPVGGTTRIDICIYDAASNLINGLGVDRAGQTCAGKPCWKAVKTSGYKYKDKAVAADGVKKIKYKGGDFSKGKLSLQAKNNAKKGQVGLPTGIAAALGGALSARAQVIASDGACFDALITQVKKNDGLLFKGKGP